MKDISSFEAYTQDPKTQSAVERQLGIIGEAVIQFSKTEHLEHATQIRGFRNRLIHAYDSIDDSVIWAIVHRHLPLLRREVTKRIEA